MRAVSFLTGGSEVFGSWTLFEKLCGEGWAGVKGVESGERGVGCLGAVGEAY